MTACETLLGWCLLGFAMLDVFLTVLYARVGYGKIAQPAGHMRGQMSDLDPATRYDQACPARAAG